MYASALRLVPVTDRARVASALQADPLLHLYELGDLDPFFWPSTTWFGLEGASQRLLAILLIYAGGSKPTVICLDNDPTHLELLQHLVLSAPLPSSFWAHLSPNVKNCLAGRYTITDLGHHEKMALRHPASLDCIDVSRVSSLCSLHLDGMIALYKEAYPGNWFDPRMLETGQYFGVWADESSKKLLLCVAGVHVYSEEYKIAVIGNVTCHPSHRGKGLASAAVARLCKSLLGRGIVDIGLNVETENHGAIRLYQRLGFTRCGEYEEFLLERKISG